MNLRNWLPEDTALSFANPWLLLLLLALPLLAYLRGQRGPAAALIFSSTTVLRGLGKAQHSRGSANFSARCCLSASRSSSSRWPGRGSARA